MGYMPSEKNGGGCFAAYGSGASVKINSIMISDKYQNISAQNLVTSARS